MAGSKVAAAQEQTKQGLRPAGSRANRLLASLSPRDCKFLEPHLKLVALAGGSTLFEPGDDVHTTYFPNQRTMVSLLSITREGDAVEVATIGREGAVGGIVSSGHKPAFTRAQVQIGGPAYTIATDRLEEAKDRSPAVEDLFDRYADALLAQVMQSAACNALHSIEQRCCRWLLSTHDRAGDHLFDLTQQSLADMLGVQRTTVSTVCSHLQAAGLIAYRRGRVEILDRRGLERAACECYALVEQHFARLLPEAVLSEPADRI